jgi:hypothetical protein
MHDTGRACVPPVSKHQEERNVKKSKSTFKAGAQAISQQHQ